MSLTRTSGAYAGVHEDGVNDFVAAFFISRPRYLRWGSPAFVSATSVTETQIPAIPPFGIEYLIEFDQPVLDLHPDTKGFDLPPGPNQFALQIKLRLTVGCHRKRRNPQDEQPILIDPTSTELAVCARGTLIRLGNDIRLVVDEVQVKDIHPNSLGDVLSCLLRTILQEAVNDLRIPYRSIFIQIGTLVYRKVESSLKMILPRHSPLSFKENHYG